MTTNDIIDDGIDAEAGPGDDALPGEFTYDIGEGETVCEAVVYAVSAATNQEPTDVDPLYEWIDADALNTLFRSASGADAADAGCLVTFSFADCEVTVGHGEWLRVRH